jgi:hypothetical protein
MFERTARLGRIAILWRGDEAARRGVSPKTSRCRRLGRCSIRLLTV